MLQQNVTGVQREVFALLIDERIAADASLTVFLGLSNRILDEVDRRIAASTPVLPTN